MGTYHVLASCMLLYVSLTCNLMQNYYKKKKIKKIKMFYKLRKGETLFSLLTLNFLLLLCIIKHIGVIFQTANLAINL